MYVLYMDELMCSTCMQVPMTQEGIGFPVSAATGCCELSGVPAGNPAQVLCKSNACS